MKTKIMLPAIAIVLTGFAAFGAVSAFAQSSTSTTYQHASIIQKLVNKFGLNEAEVKVVFDEERIERQKEMQKRMEEKLNLAVSEGKLTQEQKQLIIAKHVELEKQREVNRESMINLSEEERKAKMEEYKSELEAWAKENNIDMKYLFGRMKMKGMHMMK